jgi:group II intron reverse transcriptase/maturase
MKKLARLLAISKLSQKDKNWIHKDLFRILSKDEIWIAAYEKLKSNKGALTPGSNPSTMDGMSLIRLKNLKESVYSETYVFKPFKLTFIPRPDSRKRPLGLPTANDKIVQQVIYLILEAIYEPIFSKHSFGFRAELGLGCHYALNHVEQKFRWVDYVVESEIKQTYPTIDHQILINILEKRVHDVRFIRLIRKLLKCGVLFEERIAWSKTGVSQGSIVSPILFNIYYDELDRFVQQLMKQYSTSKDYRRNFKSSESKTLEHGILKLSKEMNILAPQSPERKECSKTLKILRAKRLAVPSLKNKITRIEYVRYVDDWMVGVAGDRQLAQQIKAELTIFMKDTLLQKLHPAKTKVSNLRKGNVYFLGYEIFLPNNRSISGYKGKGTRTISRGQPRLRFDIPINIIIERYTNQGYLKKLEKGVRPISRASYTTLEDHVIVSHYRSLWLGILNYYSGCTKRGRLQYIHYLLHMSCAMTLAHRHRSSSQKIFQKHGKYLKVKIPNHDKTVEFPYKTTWRWEERKWLLGKSMVTQTFRYSNLVSRSSLKLPCIICDSVSNQSKCTM